ncbi:MAG: hypothetical protein AB7P21_22695 [Lautropia sp.]
MVDTLGSRCTFGIVTPSTNTVVQPEYDDMRPVGVTNHIARMHIPNDPIGSDGDFDELIRRIDAALDAAIERVLTAQPDRLVLGISAESVWGGGMAAAAAIGRRVDKLSNGLPFTQAADALPAALKALGVRGKVALVTPYFPIAGKHLTAYVKEIGYEAGPQCFLSRPSPVDIARTPIPMLVDAIREVDAPDVAAIVQFGANLPMGRLAASAEAMLGKPVIAVNVATYWHALRSAGLNHQMTGYGRLMSEC